VLCEACHLKQHHGTAKIDKKILTSEGIELQKISHVPEEKINNTLVKSHLMYQRMGWYYRLKETDSWKKLLPRSYKTVFTKLNKLNSIIPCIEKDITTYLHDYQTDYLVL
jgi:hypothetical protein